MQSFKTNLDKHFKVDENHQEQGVDFVINDKTSFRIRHFSVQNPRIKAAMAKHHKPYARQIEMGTLDDKKLQELSINLFLDVALVSWQGVEDEAGQPIECTKDNALTLFKSLPNLFDSLWKHSQDFNNYREELGNS